jgi:pheromone shutdown protein TraB
VQQSSTNLFCWIGRLAYSLAGGTFSGFVTIHFCSDGDDGESRLIKTGVIKGLMAPRSDHVINVVNADVVSKAHGLHITEIKTSPVVDENEVRKRNMFCILVKTCRIVLCWK